jgi:hypothetical protein
MTIRYKEKYFIIECDENNDGKGYTFKQSKVRNLQGEVLIVPAIIIQDILPLKMKKNCGRYMIEMVSR